MLRRTNNQDSAYRCFLTDEKDPDLIVVPQASKVTLASGTIRLQIIQQFSQGFIFDAGCLLRCTQIAHIIMSRHMNDNGALEWSHDPFDADLNDETQQDAENTLEESCGADRITLSNDLLKTGAQFDNESTDFTNPVFTPFDPHGHRIPELDHMTYEDRTRQRFQTPGSSMRLPQEDRLMPETSASNYFPPGQHDSRFYFLLPMSYTSIEQSHSPASIRIPIARTTPTSLPNTGPQSPLLSSATSVTTASSRDGSGVCPECGDKVSNAAKLVDRNKNVNRHMRERHGQPVNCPECDQTFPRPSNMQRHFNNTHRGRSED